MLAISDRFAAQCSPVIGLSNDTCGSITRASLKHLTASELDALFTPSGLFADLDAWLFHSIEMAACGVQRYAMYDWIMANADMTKARAAINPGQKVMGGPSLIQPFIIANQESVVNKDHWKVTSGWTPAAYDALNGDLATYPLTNAQIALGDVGTDRVIRVETRHGIPLDVNWFRNRDVLFLFNVSGPGVAQQGNWRVLASAVNAAASYVDLVVRSENAGSAGAFDAAPTAGYIIPGINNVHDFESWCQNRANIDPRKKVLFFYQTMREARCTDEQYELVYERLFDANPAFKEFGDIDMAKRNAQDEHNFQVNLVNAIFFQKPLPNQDKENWESLEAINTIAGSVLDPSGVTASGGQLIARRANFVGWKEQLRVCDRVKDLQKNKLNLYEFLDFNYDLVRARKTGGRKVTDIDWFCNSIFKANFYTAYIDYLDVEFKGKEVFNIEQGKVNEMGMIYDSFFFKRPSGIRINLTTDEFFDDLYDENVALGQPTVGNLLLALDIGKPSGNTGGSMYYAHIASNRREYKTADIQDLAKYDSTFRCVMEVSHKMQTLTSQAGMPIVECPLKSLWIHNFSVEPPITTGRSYPYDNLV